MQNDSIVIWNCDSSVGTVTGPLDERSVVWFPTTAKYLFLSSPKRPLAMQPNQSGIQCWRELFLAGKAVGEWGWPFSCTKYPVCLQVAPHCHTAHCSTDPSLALGYWPAFGQSPAQKWRHCSDWQPSVRRDALEECRPHTPVHRSCQGITTNTHPVLPLQTVCHSTTYSNVVSLREPCGAATGQCASQRLCHSSIDSDIITLVFNWWL